MTQHMDLKAWFKTHWVELVSFGAALVGLWLLFRGRGATQSSGSLIYPNAASGGGTTSTGDAASSAATDPATTSLLSSLKTQVDQQQTTILGLQSQHTTDAAAKAMADRAAFLALHSFELDTQAKIKSILDQLAALQSAQAAGINQGQPQQQAIAQQVAQLQAQLAAALHTIAPATNTPPSPNPSPATNGTGPAGVPPPTQSTGAGAIVPNPIAGSIFNFGPPSIASVVRLSPVPAPPPAPTGGTPGFSLWDQVAAGQFPGQNIVQQLQQAAYQSVAPPGVPGPSTPGLASQHPE